MMNQGMTGFAPNHAIVIFTDYVDNGLTGFLKTLVPVYTQLRLLTDVVDTPAVISSKPSNKGDSR